MSEYDFTPIICIAALVFLAFWTIRQVKAFHQLEEEGRPDERIPVEEMRLMGEDYREHVDSYFRKVSRRREIVRDITGASS